MHAGPQRPEFPRGCDGRLHLRGVGHVGCDEARAEFRRRLLAGRMGQVADHDAGAEPGQFARACQAQAGRAAGHERADAVDVHADLTTVR